MKVVSDTRRKEMIFAEAARCEIRAAANELRAEASAYVIISAQHRREALEHEALTYEDSARQLSKAYLAGVTQQAAELQQRGGARRCPGRSC